MAKRFFAQRDRAHTTGNPISNPTLTFTDALPRSDLRDLGQVNPTRPDPKRSKTAPIPEWPQRKSSKETRSNHAFDFQIPSGTQQHVQSPVELRHNAQEDQMIGIALGSPSAQKPLQFSGSPEGPNGRVETPSVVEDDNDPVVERKPSKWKKIGGLFRAKASFQQQSQPFYQVKMNDQPLHQQREGPESPDAELQYASLYQSPPRSKKDASNEQRAHEIGVAIDKPPKGQRSRSGSTQAEGGGSPEKPKKTGEMPHLTVDIPDVQMERYSVMFGNVLGKDQSSGLLARRSKTLEKLKTCDEEVLSPREPSLSEFPLPRRATSPSLTTTPTFNIFPATPVSKASKVLGNHAIPRGPAPLHRSNTAPVSPSRTFFDHDQAKGPPPAVHENTSLGTSSTSRTQSAAGGSLLSVSSADSLTSQDSNTIVLQLKPCPNVAGKEPAWEMIKPEGKPKSKPAKELSPKLSKARSEELLANKPVTPSPRKKVSTPTISVTTHNSPQKSSEKDLPPPPPPDRKPPASPTTGQRHIASLKAPTSPGKPPPAPAPSPPQLIYSKPNTQAGKPPPAPAPNPPRSTSFKPNRSVGRPRPAVTTAPPRSTSLNPNIPAVKAPSSPTPSPPRTTSLKPHNPALASRPEKPKQEEPAKSKSPRRKKPELDTSNDDTNRVEISVARSISVSRRMKLTLVPIGARTDTLQPEERPVEKRVGTPTLLAMQKGHRHEKSQEVMIETA